MGDWLGSGMVAKGKEIFLPVSEARDHARSLPLKSQAAWKAYCSSGDKPKNIPAHPEHVYRKMGWLGWGDWLGVALPLPVQGSTEVLLKHELSHTPLN